MKQKPLPPGLEPIQKGGDAQCAPTTATMVILSEVDMRKCVSVRKHSSVL